MFRRIVGGAPEQRVQCFESSQARLVQRKKFAGKLAGYEDGAVLLDMGGAEPVRFEKAEVALVRLRVEF